VRWIRVLVCAAACTAACALPGSSQAPTPAQMLSGRLAAFAAAKSVTMSGHVVFDKETYRVSLLVDDRGQASGTLGYGPFLVATLRAGGRTFLRSTDYYNSLSLATADQWVLEADSHLLQLLTRLIDRKALAAALLAAAGPGVQQVASPDAGGVKMLRLASPDLSTTTPAAGGPPVRVVTGVDTALSDGLSDVQLDLSDYGKPPGIAAPDSFLDRAQPDSWPAHYTAVIGPDTPFSWEPCDRSGCTLTASFKNWGGRVGSATATFYVSLAGTTMGTCDVPIPVSGNGATVRAGCRVSFDFSQRVSGNVEVHNPR
jgi:hypothetical protein